MATSRPREAVFHEVFREDLHYWVKNDRKVALRLIDLVEAIMREPFTGIGKPEPLRYLAANTWSRRLTHEHRVMYVIFETRIVFIHAREHY